MGYEKNYQVEAPGQFSIRGGIVDIAITDKEGNVIVIGTSRWIFVNKVCKEMNVFRLVSTIQSLP